MDIIFLCPVYRASEAAVVFLPCFRSLPLLDPPPLTPVQLIRRSASVLAHGEDMSSLHFDRALRRRQLFVQTDQGQASELSRRHSRAAGLFAPSWSTNIEENKNKNVCAFVCGSFPSPHSSHGTSTDLFQSFCTPVHIGSISAFPRAAFAD